MNETNIPQTQSEVHASPPTEVEIFIKPFFYSESEYIRKTMEMIGEISWREVKALKNEIANQKLENQILEEKLKSAVGRKA